MTLSTDAIPAPARALLVPARFNGPPASGNGGWTAGALAALIASSVGPTVTVRLQQPPPLGTAMALQADDGWTVALRDGAPVARARAGDADLTPVPGVAFAQARAAEPGYAGHREHPFPTCFSCGVDREPGDGLRIFPGPVAAVEGRSRVAATWTPQPGVAGEGDRATRQATAPVTAPVTWAALDCVSAWACDLTGRPMVLGQMTARLDALPEVGAGHVVVGEHRGDEGRRTSTASSLYDASGRLLATAEHVWVAVDPDAFR
ncbi:hypothetical protein [Nocardioides ferulae]|uniref:hypothetical protein n=1 Tax=Nocardioides ferulae TaxID=2340821 RepID=UPI001F0C699F|nr:hypothetical protein [Nocardioides ferulae]